MAAVDVAQISRDAAILALELVDCATGLLNFLGDQLALKLVDRATSFVYEAA